MKNIYFLLIILSFSLAFNESVAAQNDSSGIYVNGNDFSSGKLSLAINCATEEHKIKLNDFFNKPYIIVKHNDSSYNFMKKDLFGYKMCNGNIYRFNGEKDLLLLNPAEQILIYSHIPNRTRGLTNVTSYYFSINATSPVQLLTKKNLKRAYAANQKFVNEIDRKFKYNTELAAYDKYHSVYKINWIYQITIK
ncbi:hypothetical protein FC093_17160 [Ilyomonas limi]|uniref:Uncharacterized protein n=1 Tax=Ilyomonas limi TaxID=2575867 RepID=A0A4U3KXB0_9BACT|nr:hypothetical protein [Ilyomonas limi]TKK66314.1 hypothetical protein FC093_17160 [Ilyomonas limi]